MPRIQNTGGKRIIELGAQGPGSPSFFENRSWPFGLPQILALDIGGPAEGLEAGGVVYRRHDVRGPWPRELTKADVILDSHCLHCLVNERDWGHALGHIRHALAPTGLFASEMMVAHARMSFAAPLFFEKHTATLYLMAEGSPPQPLRRILEAYQIERGLLEAGFEILYFVCSSARKFTFWPELPYAPDSGPDILQFIARPAEGQSLP